MDVMRHVVRIKGSLTNLLLHKAGLKTNDYDDTVALTTFRNRVKQDADNINNKTQRIITRVSESNEYLITEMILNNKSMDIKYTDQDKRNVTYKEALTQATSSALNLLNIDIDKFTM
jgi:hypothetical protein